MAQNTQTFSQAINRVQDYARRHGMEVTLERIEKHHFTNEQNRAIYREAYKWIIDAWKNNERINI